LCYSVDDVVNAIKLYSKKDSKTVDIHNKIGNEIRNNFFEPVSKLGIRRFLNL